MSNGSSYIFALVAIIAINVVVLGSGGITGAQTTGAFRSRILICEETDPRQNEFVLGVVKIKERGQVLEKPDKCFGKTVVQYFCTDTINFDGVGRYCKNGCLDGVCIKGK